LVTKNLIANGMQTLRKASEFDKKANEEILKKIHEKILDFYSPKNELNKSLYLGYHFLYN
jgi:hypothetical protein